MKFHETHQRSVVKGITYSGAVIVVDVLILLFLTHEAMTAVKVIVATNLASVVIYYLHARAWNEVHWGKVAARRRSRKAKTRAA